MPQRRQLILGAGVAGLATLAGCATALRSRTQASEAPLGPADLALVNRITWGVDSAAVARRQQGSRRDYLESQLHPAGDDALPPAVRAQIDALGSGRQLMQDQVAAMAALRKAADGVDGLAEKMAARQAYQQAMNRLARDAASQTLLRALHGSNQLQEQLAWFWFNHFNVHQYKADLRAMVGDYQARLRGLALGRFADLLIASATHPAMIRYLDNQQNAAGRINENYARELLELHTLGVDGGYTQTDVQELARVLTGLGTRLGTASAGSRAEAGSRRVDRDGLSFDPARHDAGTKRVLGQDVAGRGLDEIVEQLVRLARHPATARHVSYRLALHFVSDSPSTGLVEQMSRTFAATDGHIASTLRTLFDTPEFEASLGRKFKDPVHYVVSAARLAWDGVPTPDTGPLLGWLNRLGEGLYNRQTPDGYPLDAAAWSGSGQMSTRFEIARAIGSGGAGPARADGMPADATVPALADAVERTGMAPTLGERTRVALAGASSPREWNALLLSSPDFMYR